LVSSLTGCDDELRSEDSRRDALVMLIGLLACFVLFGVAAASGLRGESLTALIDVLAGLFIGAILLAYRFSSYKRACRYVGVLMMYTLYMYLFLQELLQARPICGTIPSRFLEFS